MTRPPRDVDLLFTLPESVRSRYSNRTGNIQSQILQEVKTVLQSQYPRTKIKGDGPVVLVEFTTIDVEVVPAFKRIWETQWEILITKDGGSYKQFDPDAEIWNVRQSDSSTNGNTRNLIRMMKTWQATCSVPIKSFWLELLAVNFLATWQNRDKSLIFYDWMVRDFLAYIQNQSYVLVPGTFEILWLGSAWKSKAKSAHSRALEAIENHENGWNHLAVAEWQKIFGPDFQGP
jgi:hypothetical protein